MLSVESIAKSKIIRTLRVRVKDRHAPLLRQMAFEVNQAWNLMNDPRLKARVSGNGSSR